MGEHRGADLRPMMSETPQEKALRERFEHHYRIEKRAGGVVVVSRESGKEYTPEQFIYLLKGMPERDKKAKQSPHYAQNEDPRKQSARASDAATDAFFAETDQAMVQYAKRRLEHEGAGADLLAA